MINKFYSKYKKILLLGASGIGMSALAVHLKTLGLEVYAHDDHPNQNLFALEKKQIRLVNSPQAKNFDLIIHSLALPEEHPLLQNSIPKLTYPQALSKLLDNYQLIAISGTHGKTSTTGFLCNIFMEQKLKFSALIGSKLLNHNKQNYISQSDSSIFVCETCEYQAGFLHYTPETLVITNLEHEHFDSFPDLKSYIASFQALVDRTQKNLIINQDCQLSSQLKIPKHLQVYQFSDKHPLKLNLDMAHNNYNANAAAQVAQLYAVPTPSILQGIQDFPGTERRQQIIYQSSTKTIIDDYAHHPSEISSTLTSLKKIYGSQKICLFYQPHQVSRTQKLLPEFAQALNLADQIYIPNIYKARDESQFQDQELCQQLVKLIGNKAQYTHGLTNTKAKFAELTQEYSVIIIMGAGDILQILPDQYKS